MWNHIDKADPILLLRIHSKEQRVFAFSLDQIGGSALTPVGSSERDYTIDAHTQKQLGELLRSLLDKPDGTVHSSGFARLGQLLYDLVLPGWVQKALAEHAGAVMIQASDVGLPWELLHDGREFLCLRKPVSRRLAEADFAVRPTTSPREGQKIRALIVADPEDNLSSARLEAAELGDVFSEFGVETTALVGSNRAQWDVVLEHLAARRPEHCYNIIHLAGHIREHPHEQGASSRAFALSRGAFLSPEHIVRRFGCPSALVFINACFGHPLESGTTAPSFSTQMGQARSLVSAFLSYGGCKGVIGTMWWVVDEVAHGISKDFYRDLLSGATVGDALLHVRQQIGEQQDPALWAGYIHYGDPRLVLAQRESQAPPDLPLKVPVAPTPAVEPESPDPALSIRTVAPMSLPPSEKPVDAALKDAAQSLPLNSGSKPLEVDSLPLDASGRLALLNAFHEQQEMQWPALSTIHLLVGMLQIADGSTAQLLKPADIPPQRLIQLLREALGNESSNDSHDPAKEEETPGVRPNVLEVLQRSCQRVKEAGHKAVGEPDILEAILSMPDCGAYLILACVLEAAGQDLDVLVRSPRRLEAFLPGGGVNLAVLAPELVAALECAVTEAKNTHWEEVRSPHLAMGVLARPGSLVMRHGNDGGIPMGKLLELMRKAFGQSARPTVDPRLHREFISDNAIKYLDEACRLATARGARRVGEADLWRALLGDASGIVAQALVGLGLSPLQLLPRGW